MLNGGKTTRSPWWQVLAAPWLGLFRPRWAGTTMARGPAWAAWLSFLISFPLVPAGVVLAALWCEAIVIGSPGGVPASQTAATPAPQILMHRSLGDVWWQWRQLALNPAVPLAVIPIACTLAGAALAALMRLPVVHAGGRVLPSIDRSLRAVASGIGLLTLLTWPLATLFVLADRDVRLHPSGRHLMEIMFVAGTPTAALFLFWWLGLAATGAKGEEAEPTLPPRCEDCGYDLTHRPESGLCPECGLAIVDSLGHAAPPLVESPPEELPHTRGARRIGCAWESDAGSRSGWVETTIEILRRPTAFYSRLRLRSDPSRALRFAWLHIASIGVAAWVGMFMIVFLSSRGSTTFRSEVILEVPTVVSLLASLSGIVLHRVVGGLTMLWWTLHGYLGDVRWSRKVIAYEAAFLWVFCAYSGLVFSTAILLPNSTGRAISQAVRNAFGVPLPPLLIAFGNAALILLWLYRYRLAGKAVRWSNF